MQRLIFVRIAAEVLYIAARAFAIPGTAIVRVETGPIVRRALLRYAQGMIIYIAPRSIAGYEGFIYEKR